MKKGRAARAAGQRATPLQLAEWPTTRARELSLKLPSPGANCYTDLRQTQAAAAKPQPPAKDQPTKTNGGRKQSRLGKSVHSMGMYDVPCTE
jgi:hypothetical protein